MAHRDPPSLPDLVQSLFACPPEYFSAWLEQHRSHLNLSLLQQVKTILTFDYILAEPQQAGQVTNYLLAVAQFLPNEPLGLPLVHWTRGLWAMVHEPLAAIEHFRQALAGYEQAGDALSVARLASNLVGVLTECGRFDEAEAAYERAQSIIAAHGEIEPFYLLALEQNYGWLLHNQGRYEQALQVHERALALANRHDLTAIAAEIGVNRALALGMLGRLADVEADLLRDRTVALAHDQALTVARIDMNLGELYTHLGRPAEALRRFHLAQDAFVALENGMEVGSVMLRQAVLLQRIGSLRAALQYFALALQTFTDLGLQPQVGEILVHYAGAQRAAGQYRRAGDLLERAEQIWQRLGNSSWLVATVCEGIELALELGDNNTAQELGARATAELLPPLNNPRLNAQVQLLAAEALRQGQMGGEAFLRASAAYEAALSYGRPEGDRWLQHRALVGHGKLLQVSDPTQAQTDWEAAAALDDEMRQMLSVEELKAGYHARADELYAALIQMKIAQQNSLQALAYTWKYKSSALTELLASLAVEQELTAVEQTEIEQVRQQLATLRWALAMEQNQQTNPEIAELERQLLDLRRRRNRQHAAPYERLYDDPVSMLAALDADCLLEYVCCDDQIVGFFAARTGVCHVRTLATTEQMDELAGRLQLRLQRVVTQPASIRVEHVQAWVVECLPLLTECYDRLVRPLLETVGAAPARVLIAPCAPLFLLPFAAFWNGRSFWMEECELESIQSGALLGLARRNLPATSPPLIVAASAGAMTAVRDEAAAIASVLPRSTVFVDVPVIDHIRALPAPPRILHIASHTLLREDAPLFSGLQLAGEVLSVEACYDLPLAGTELVALSGCTTVAGLESDAMLLAFQSAFFVAGAERVIASLWPVADEASAVWMAHFYTHLAAGCSVAQAVQRTQLALLADPAYRHPALWAAFACSRC